MIDIFFSEIEKVEKDLDTLQIFIDNYEFIAGKDDLYNSNYIEKFKSLNCNLVMGAEKGLWPPTNYTHLYENKRAINDSKYLNSGTYFGYTNKIVNHVPFGFCEELLNCFGFECHFV